MATTSSKKVREFARKLFDELDAGWPGAIFLIVFAVVVGWVITTFLRIW